VLFQLKATSSAVSQCDYPAEALDEWSIRELITDSLESARPSLHLR
jgi:hypothetical protein